MSMKQVVSYLARQKAIREKGIALEDVVDPVELTEPEPEIADDDVLPPMAVAVADDDSDDDDDAAAPEVKKKTKKSKKANKSS